MNNPTNNTPLYGLVLTGGQSTRMKQDKAGLEYHGRKQYLIAAELLSQFCEKVFISSRSDQAAGPTGESFPRITDRQEFAGIGPLAGILSAMLTHPNAAWLVLACDLPFVNPQTISDLLAGRDPQKIATAFRSSHDGLPEPLCAIFEPHALPVLKEFLNKGINCPRKILIQSSPQILTPSDPRALDNINTPQEYEQALQVIARPPHRMVQGPKQS